MALNFGGTSQYVEIPDSISLRLSGQCFMSSWVYINSFPASNKYSSIIVKKYDGSKIGYFLDIYNSSGTLKLRVGSYQNANYATVWDITGWNTEEWNWISGGYDGSNWNLYFNEEMKSQTSQGTGAISASLPVNLGCTNLNGTYDRFLNGMLFDTRIYNRYPSANEIAEIYHRRGADRIWQGLVGRWRLDELSSGTPAPILLDSMDSTSDYTVSTSGTISLNTTTYQEGTGALNAEKTSTSVNYFFFRKAIAATNVSNQNIKLWVYIKNETVLNKISKIEFTLYSTLATNGKRTEFTNLNVGWNLLSRNINDFEITYGTFDPTAVLHLYYAFGVNNNSYTTSGDDVVYDFAQAGDYTPNSIIDLSGNGNHGTPYNSPVYQSSPHRLRRGVLIS